MEHVNINLNSVKKGTVFKGIGTSLCWFANVIGKSDDKESVDKLCNLLFDKTNEKGLKLNFVRYNIGASNPNTEKNFRMGGAVPAYVGKDWSDIDNGQRYFLKKAKELGVENFEIFSNSPPNSMTVSGSTAGSAPWKISFIKQDITFSNNLKNECIDEFSRYLVDVTKYLSEHDGINFSSISPYNEISGPGWQKNNNQEGCFYGYAGIRGRVIKSLQKELNKQDMKQVEIAACEENNMLFGFLGILFNPFMWKNVQRFNVHRYRWGDALGFNTHAFEDSNIFRKLIRWILGKKPIVMTEFGMGYMNDVTRYDDFKNVLNLALFIIDDFNYLHPEMWCYWQIVEDLSGNGWGALQVSFNNPSQIVFGAQYQCLQMFSHFIKPNSILLNLPQLKNKNLSWIGSQNEKEIGLVILSKESSDITLQFNQHFSNTVISVINEKNLKCDGSGIMKTNMLGNINEIVIPANSLIGVSFTI